MCLCVWECFEPLPSFPLVMSVCLLLTVRASRGQVAAARRREGVAQQVIEAYGQARELGEVRSKAALWDDSGAEGLPRLA